MSLTVAIVVAGARLHQGDADGALHLLDATNATGAGIPGRHPHHLKDARQTLLPMVTLGVAFVRHRHHPGNKTDGMGEDGETPTGDGALATHGLVPGPGPHRAGLLGIKMGPAEAVSVMTVGMHQDAMDVALGMMMIETIDTGAGNQAGKGAGGKMCTIDLYSFCSDKLHHAQYSLRE